MATASRIGDAHCLQGSAPRLFATSATRSRPSSRQCRSATTGLRFTLYGQHRMPLGQCPLAAAPPSVARGTATGISSLARETKPAYRVLIVSDSEFTTRDATKLAVTRIPHAGTVCCAASLSPEPSAVWAGLWTARCRWSLLGVALSATVSVAASIRWSWADVHPLRTVIQEPILGCCQPRGPCRRMLFAR